MPTGARSARDFTDPDQLLLHTCDTGAASSGSPLLVEGPDGPEVVGINVGTYVQSKVIMLNGEVLHRFKSDDVANTGVNALAFAASLGKFLEADTLTTRKDVRRLQDALPRAASMPDRAMAASGRDCGSRSKVSSGLHACRYRGWQRMPCCTCSTARARS